jgi:hypothetical protein
MKTAYDLYLHWVDYGRPGGTQWDYDVFRGSKLVGRFETHELAELEIQKLRAESPDYVSGINGEFMTNSYEIKTIDLTTES